jgi:hypothetical protein
VLQILIHFLLILHQEQLLVLGCGITLFLVDEGNDYFLEVIVDLAISTVVFQVLVVFPGRVIVGLALPANLTRVSNGPLTMLESYPITKVLLVELVIREA